MARELPLTRGYVALVDDSDFEDVSRHSWQVTVIERKIGPRFDVTRTYRKSGSRKTHTMRLGRYLLNLGPGAEVDHVNGNTLDFQRPNLRPATRSQNGANRRKSSLSRSPYKGIYLHKASGKWAAEAKLNGKVHRFGHFDTPEEAARAYDDGARKLHGEFARFNFPNDGERHV